MKGEFDLACDPNSSPFYDPTINKVVGKFMDEASRQSITEFVCLKPKMYSYQTLNDPSYVEAPFTTKKPAKRIQRAAVGKLRHHKFKA